MLTEFIRYLSAERRYSPLTVRNYKHDVGQFLAWLDFDEARSDPRSITADQVREWDHPPHGGRQDRARRR